MKYLLDTNILSELVRPRPDPRVMSRARALESVCVTSSTVYLELWTGVEVLPDTERARYLREGYRSMFAPGGLKVLSFDVTAAGWLARESARLRRSGLPRPMLDSQIAAVAVTRELILVTRNLADFACFEGLRLENWFDAESE